MRYVIARVDQHAVAFPADRVTEMIPMPTVSAAPRMPPSVRGVIRARGAMLPLVDLRRIFGLPSSATAAGDLVTLLRDRRQDHENWLAELEHSVRESQPFKLATDPHRCAFGQWYDHYHTEHPMLASHMRRFDEPHKAIHATAAVALGKLSRGDRLGAMMVIGEARSRVLSKLIQLFTTAEGLVNDAHQEIAMLIHSGQRTYALAVDTVETLEEFQAEQIEDAASHGADRLTGVVAFAHSPRGTILVIDPKSLAEGAGIQDLDAVA